jgi:integrase
MRTRGLGRVYQPVYKDKVTGERKRSAVWWLLYSFRGKVFRESSGSARRADAVKFLRQRLAEMGQGRLVGPDAERMTFADLATMLLEDYRIHNRKSARRAAIAVKRLHEFFGFFRAVEMTSDRVAAYVRLRHGQKVKPATIRYELACLKRMFTLAVRADKALHRPHIPTIEVRNTRQGFFEEPEFRTVMTHLPEEIKPVILFAYLTGWRRGEILSLQWRQVDFEAGTIRLEPGTTKNRRGEGVPLCTPS